MNRTTINIILLSSLSIIIWLAMYVAWGKIEIYHKNRTPFVAEVQVSNQNQKDTKASSDNPANPNNTSGGINERNPNSRAGLSEDSYLDIRKSTVNEVVAGLSDHVNESTVFSSTASQPPAEGTTRGLFIWLLYETDHCTTTPDNITGYAVDFRHESAAIKGGSLRMVDNLIRTYRNCQPATFIMAEHPDGKRDSTPSLIQRREDEVVYYLLHMQVAKSDVRTSTRNLEKL